MDLTKARIIVATQALAAAAITPFAAMRLALVETVLSMVGQGEAARAQTNAGPRHSISSIPPLTA